MIHKKLIQKTVICFTVLLFGVYSYADPIVLSVDSLPLTTFKNTRAELAVLNTPLSNANGDQSDSYAILTKNKIESGYGYGLTPGRLIEELPDEWFYSWDIEDFLQTQATATLKRGQTKADISFERKGFKNLIGRFTGMPAEQVYGIVNLNSRYLAIEGSGEWRYRFFDKAKGVFLPYAIANISDQKLTLLIDRRGFIYIYPYINQLIPSLATGPQGIKQIQGIRLIQFSDNNTLESTLTPEQIKQWRLLGGN